MRKGFTLVELLAVIVILAVILVIAVPQINNVIKQTKMNSLGSTAKIIAAKAEEKAVENEILEGNESLSCANLVKLDDNYGSCTVSMVNGKGTVTINGAGKFAGITCTGTKDNMTCTEGNTPQYIYSYGIPYYEYVYEVKTGKLQECKNWIIYDYWGYEDPIDEYDDLVATNVCSNSDDVYNDGNGNEWDTTTNEWFDNEISDENFTFEEVNSFVTMRPELRVNTENSDDGVSEDYTTLKFPDTNIQSYVFLRWNANEGPYTNTSEKSVCIIYEGNLECFEAKSSAYETNKSKLIGLFGDSACSITTRNSIERTDCYTSGEWSTVVDQTGKTYFFYYFPNDNPPYTTYGCDVTENSIFCGRD